MVSSPNCAMISVNNLSKSYDGFLAVDDVSFTVGQGEFFALIGTNGAGKTTTISALTTLTSIDAGMISVAGYDCISEAAKVRENIGVVFQQSILEGSLSVKENIRLFADIHHVERARVDQIIDMLDLREQASRRYAILSGGQKRRVDIACALVHQPRILFLDEPTTGLDPRSREQIWALIARLRKDEKLTIMVTTHYLEEADQADRVAIIDRGTLITCATPADLRAEYGRVHLILTPLTGEERTIIDYLESHDLRCEIRGGTIQSQLEHSHQALAIVNGIAVKIRDFQIVCTSMDEIFIRLIESRQL